MQVKPCPFCGKTVQVSSWLLNRQVKKAMVKCVPCCVELQRTEFGLFKTDCDKSGLEQIAIDAWNKRS